MAVHVWIVWIVIVWWFVFGTLVLLFGTLVCLVLWLLLQKSTKSAWQLHGTHGNEVAMRKKCPWQTCKQQAKQASGMYGVATTKSRVVLVKQVRQAHNMVW